MNRRSPSPQATTAIASGIIPVFSLFLLSGATGLAYEVIWTRMLVRVFGASSFAVSTVLAAYMAGFALGSYLFGRLIDRKGNPVLIYGLLELGVGIFAVVFPFILAGMDPLYRGVYGSLEGNLYSLSIIRFLLSFTVLLIPTTLMGGTLPILSRFVTGSLSNLTLRVGWLYSINTFGAVAGTFLTGFVLLPSLGMRVTTFTAACVNIAIFFVCLALSRRRRQARADRAAAEAPVVEASGPREGDAPKAPAPSGAARPHSSRDERLVLFGFLLTGLAALAGEVIWTRVLALVVGTTVYAFSIMLTVFLLGLALGSAVFARIGQRTARPRLFFGLLVVGIGFAVFASTVAFTRLPVFYMDLHKFLGTTWEGSIAIEFLLSLVIMIVPAFLMGGTFPIVARIYATDLGRVGGRIGTAYAFNTIGSILGSFLGSFVLLRLLGVEKGMMAVSFIYLAVGILIFLLLGEGIGRRLRLAGSAVVLAAALVIAFLGPGWDKKMMTSGVYVYARAYVDRAGLKAALNLRELLSYDEGPGATVSVERSQDVLSLKIDGKVDASTGADMITQELIAHLPLLMHPKPDTVLVIGLGSGVSLGSAEQHPVQHLDCVELLKNVADAVGFFKEATYDCLADPRVNLIMGDGRNHVLLTDKKYDVIISEPTNVWISGVGDLFTREFFSLARRRLKPGGVMSVFFHIYHMGDPELRSGVRSFLQVFPNATLWLSSEADLILVGTLEPTKIDEDFIARVGLPAVAGDLKRIGVNRPSDLLSALLLDKAGLEAYSRDARIHTDDNMLMEFTTGRRVAQRTQGIHLANLLERFKPIRFGLLDPATNEQIALQANAKRLTMRGTLERLQNRTDQGLRDYESAYSLAPGDPYVLSRYVEAYVQVGDAALGGGDYEGAKASYEKVVAARPTPSTWIAYDGLGLLYLNAGMADEARQACDRSIEMNPHNSLAFSTLGDAHFALGDTLAAIAAYDKSFDLGRWNLEAANSSAWFRAIRGETLDRALELAKATTQNRKEPNYFDTLGWIYYKRGDLGRSVEALRRALDLDPDRVESIYHLALVRGAQGKTVEMQDLLRRVVELDLNGEFGTEAAGLLKR